MEKGINPTKKQKALLDFIDGFVKGRGYSPTYREIMQALGYKSVSTVAKHVDNLIVRGWLLKREGEARSLEVVHGGPLADEMPWAELEKEIERRAQSDGEAVQAEVEILRQALVILRK